jgi:hypothetical protein
MVVDLSTSTGSFSFGAPCTHVEASLVNYMGTSMDSGCRSNPLPSNGNPGRASFSDIVKNVSCFSHLLVQEDLAITIPIVRDVSIQTTFYGTNGLVSHFNSL